MGSKKLTISLSLLLMCSLFKTMRADFCHPFLTASNERIFGYQLSLIENYLFIGKKYWKFNNLMKASEPKLESINEREFNFSGRNCEFAFSFRLCTERSCKQNADKIKWITAFQEKPIDNILDYRKLSLNWGQLNDPGKGLIGLNVIYSFGISLRVIEKPSLAFYYSGDIICFFQQIKNDSKFLRSFECGNLMPWDYNNPSKGFGFVPKQDHVSTEQRKGWLDYPATKDIMTNLSDTKEVIAIFYIPDRSSYLFIHREDNRITYCLSDGIIFVKGCTSKSKSLTDCLDYVEYCKQYCGLIHSKEGNNSSKNGGHVGAVFGDAKRPLSGEFEPEVTEQESATESITSCEPTEDPISITLVVLLILMIIVFIYLLVYHLIQIWATPPPKAG